MQTIRQVLAIVLLSILLPATGSAAISFDSTLLDTEIVGGNFLVAASGNIEAQFLGSDAGYFNTLYLSSPGDGSMFVFNKSTAVNSVFNLGYFDEGTELIFRLHVSNTSNDFFSGPSSRNEDGLAHAMAITSLVNGIYTTTVGFEDLYGGGDNDFNDFMFSLNNVVDPVPSGSRAAGVPEPAPLALLALGLLLAGFAGKRRS